MTITGDDVDEGEQLAAHAEPNRAAWQRTVEDMEALATDREAAGWDVVAVAAAHTEPVSEDGGETDRYGLVHVVPDNEADAIAEACERGDFPRYDVYRGATETRTFLVTELVDPDAETALLLAGNFRRYGSRGLIRTSHRTGRTYTHVQLLDGTHLGTFEHDDPGKFFPDTDLAAYRPDDGE